MNSLVQRDLKEDSPRVAEHKSELRAEVIRYLSDPENPWKGRMAWAGDLMGVSRQYMYQLFNPHELAQIESEARILRRKGYMGDLLEVDKKMIAKAKAGDTKAAKIVYEQLDEPVAKQVEMTGKDGGPLHIQAEILLAALVKGEE